MVQVRNIIFKPSGNPRLELFNLEGLILALNSRLADEQGTLNLGYFEERTPKKNPFLYGHGARELESRGKYPITEETDEAFCGLCGIDGERDVGYVFIETGYVTEDISEDFRYETLRLRIKSPLQLENGLLIPNCSVKIYRDNAAFDASQDRRDHVRAGLRWKRTDLSKVLPTEWLLADKNI